MKTKLEIVITPKKNNKPIKIYSLKDLDYKIPIRVGEVYPLAMKLYHVNDDFVLKVENKEDGEIGLYQSSKYHIMYNLMNTIKNKQDLLSIKRLNVRSINLDKYIDK